MTRNARTRPERSAQPREQVTFPMLEEQRMQDLTERSEERSRQKLAGVLERSITLDSLPVSAIYNNIVLDLVRYLDRPPQATEQPIAVIPDEAAELVSEMPLAVDEAEADLFSMVGVHSSG